MVELWADISVEGLRGRYQVSNLGQIRTVARRVPFGKYTGTRPIISHFVNVERDKQGYCILKVGNKQRGTKHYLVHRLVAIAFLPPAPEGKIEVNHKDGVKENNAADNLEWLSHGENERHAYSTGLKRRGKEHHFSTNRSRPWVSASVKAWWAKMTPEERSARATHSNMVRWHGYDSTARR